MWTFEDCAPVTLFFEGGLSVDPDDPGGVTNFGITQATATAHGLGDVRKLDRIDAINFYRIYFWTEYRCVLINDQVVATKVFDMLVNMTGHAVSLVQSALNVLYDSSVVVVDGALGPQTAGYLNHIEPSQMQRFLSLVKQKQRAFYEVDVARRPTLQKYLNGWIRRAYWPYHDDLRLWPYLPKPDETWPEGVTPQ